MEDVQAVVVGPAPLGTGDGGMIKKQLVETPMGQPDQRVAYIPTALALIARAGSLFFYALNGELGAGALGIIHRQTWHEAVLVAGSITAVGMVGSLATLFGNLEKKYPIVSQLT